MGKGGVAQDYAAAVVQYRLAAAQSYDLAKTELGYMYDMGYSVAKDFAEALRWLSIWRQLKGLVWHCVVSVCIMRSAGVLLPTGRRRFAGTSAPLQRDALELQTL